MYVPTPPIIYVIEAVNNLPEEAILNHAPELCHMLSNLRDDHTDLITHLKALLDKLKVHDKDAEELLTSFADERGRTVTEQFQMFDKELEEQKTQHRKLEKLLKSISTHLTTEELSYIRENSVERQEVNETVHAIMEKYEELMEKG